MAYLGWSNKLSKCSTLLLQVAVMAAISPTSHAAPSSGQAGVDGPLALIMKKAEQEKEKAATQTQDSTERPNESRFAILSDTRPAPVIATAVPTPVVSRDAILDEQAKPSPVFPPAKTAVSSQFDLPIKPDMSTTQSSEPPFDIQKTNRTWQISDKDTTLEDVLQRWTKSVGWHLVWSYPSEVSISSPAVDMNGTMTERVSSLLHSLRELPSELMSTFYTENKVLRITAKD